MFVFVDPDENKSSSLLPHLPGSVECPGLEALTGADFVVSRLPVSPVSALEVHIDRRSFFVQRKSGYDAVHFESMWQSLARMKKCGIPQQQCIKLHIGRFWEDDQGLLRVGQYKPFNQQMTYKTFLKICHEWYFYGGIIHTIEKEEQIQQWIEALQEELEQVEERGTKEIYPNRPTPCLEPDDLFGDVVEIPSSDVRYFLCAGLDGFGEKTARALQDYILNELPHLDGSGYYALKTLTEENEKGKAIHKIKGWGKKSRQKFRILLGLPSGYNLSTKEIGEPCQFERGWYAALKSFKEMVEEGHKPKQAFNALMKQSNEFFKGD